jgi:hypothetical protein
VKDLALHVLDGDLGWLSRDRDGDASGLLDPSDHGAFVAALEAKHQRWIDGADGLSRPVVVDLLRWAGAEVDAYLATVDLDEPSSVVWAGRVPRWFDVARGFTERWVHHQQLREALGLETDGSPHRGDVLRTFVWAYPHQYGAPAEPGTTIELDLDDGGVWQLVRGPAGWSLAEGRPRAPAARLAAEGDVAWRLLTGNPCSGYAVEGPPELVAPLLAVRGIVA